MRLIGSSFALLIPAFLLPSSSAAAPQLEPVDLSMDEQAKWENAPRIDIVCRTYSADAEVLWNVFFPSYLVWKSSGLVVVFDDDSRNDHVTGTILSNLKLVTPIGVKYETKPPKNTTCGDWRREGYSRQQYSNFYADLYTDAEYVAIVDGDAIFTAPVLVSDLFEDGKPRVRGFDQVSRWSGDLPKQAIGGREGVGTFMTPFSFPFVVKTAHLAQMRKDIAQNMGKNTFEGAFHMICNGNPGSYSQFDIMFNYLWYHKRHEYFWNIARVENGDFRRVKTHKTIDSFEEPATSANIPTIFIMSHVGKKTSGLQNENLYDMLCVGSNFVAGDCSSRDQAKAYKNTAEKCTGQWSVGNCTWDDTLKSHVEGVQQDSSTFVWHREVQADKVVIGA